MAGKNKKNAAEDLIESLMRDLKLDEAPIELSEETSIESPMENPTGNATTETEFGSLEIPSLSEEEFAPNNFVGLVDEREFDPNSARHEQEPTVVTSSAIPATDLPIENSVEKNQLNNTEQQTSNPEATVVVHVFKDEAHAQESQPKEKSEISDISEKTVAVTGFHQRKNEDYQDKVRVSVGQNKSAHSTGYAAWGGSNVDVNLAQAENLRIAQEKIIQLERENEKIRLQNEELISASEIIKERSDLISSQLMQLKNDREDLEHSYKNEIALLKGHIQKKEADLERTMMKNEELDSRLKFDMKKIRIRERELENRLELIRAEKNAIVKTKDDQILDLRRKMDMLQMEVDSYRQKCTELNKTIETNQESFKRTVRALRLAMANLELTEENKSPTKKAE